MRIEFQINSNRVVNRLFNDDVKLFANTTLYRLCDPFVPFREGGLSQNVDITKDFVHYKAPYSRKMYNGEDFNFNKDKHPLATAYWDREAMRTKKQELIKDVKDYIKRKG